MSRTKGQPKTGGREKGTPNKVTKEIRRWIFEMVQDNIETLENDLKDLEPKERWAIIERLLPYIVTRRQPMTYYEWESNGEEDEE